ncbi:MAG: hypothetical protein HUJ24_12335 [Rhodobacteraceae bacterium]|nr:hypothetical protein [Paracoccaceae bacterium]
MTSPRTQDDRRAALRALLGLPEGVAPLACADRAVSAADGMVREELRLGADGAIPGTLVRPEGQGPYPAVLYCHAHGGDYGIGRRELTEGRPFMPSPYAPDLVRHGWAALCIDMACFGDRQHEGPENSLAKAHLWRGGSLFAAMLADLLGALGYLAGRPDVDADRIVTLGISMGAAHAYWTAALETRIAGCAHLCMLADIGPLIAADAHGTHGFYLWVPGLSAVAETGDVAGLVAPRPQFAAHGARDALAPEAARESAIARLKRGYDYAGASNELTLRLEDQAGHEETPAMRAGVMALLKRVAAMETARNLGANT